MNEICAGTSTELTSITAQMKISVLPRGKGRNKEQTENWVRRTVLSCHADSDHFSYPLRAVPNDRPDLDIFLPGKSVGVEITEAVPRAYAAAIAYRERHFPEAVLDRSMFSWDQAPMSNEQHRVFFQKYGAKLCRSGWSRDSVEHEWANALFDRIGRKTEDLNAPGFRMFPEYWLAIYDNFKGPMLDLDLATSLLKEKLISLPSCPRTYTRFLIETNNVMVSVEPDGTVCQKQVSEFNGGGSCRECLSL